MFVDHGNVEAIPTLLQTFAELMQIDSHLSKEYLGMDYLFIFSGTLLCLQVLIF